MARCFCSHSYCSNHRTRIFEAIIAGEPEQAREASHRHLAFIEEILLDRSREESRRERSLRRLQQRKDENSGS